MAYCEETPAQVTDYLVRINVSGLQKEKSVKISVERTRWSYSELLKRLGGNGCGNGRNDVGKSYGEKSGEEG
jgi:hypothetical protein